jgi:tRNA A-37 threonylcarbamoyl transferase component Bud32
MRVAADPEGGTFRKQAESAADRDRLRSEAVVLTAVAHPGVVRLIATEGDPPNELVFGFVEGKDFAGLDIDDQEVVGGIGAAVATTLADIHDLGVVHGAVSPSHVLIDGAGRPVLCGFGAAGKASSRAQLTELAGEDTAALARMLLSRLPGSADARLRSMLRVAAGQRGRSHRGDARWLARELMRRVPGARLPEMGGQPETPANPDLLDLPTHRLPPRRWIARAAAAGVIAVGVGVAALTMRSPGSDGHSSMVTAPCPVADSSCRPVAWTGGVIATVQGRFRVSAPPRSIMVLGRWDCDGEALPAIAEVSTGSVWLFDSWPGPGQTRAARLVARVREVSDLSVIATPVGCDLLRITRTGQAAMTIRPSRT